MLDYILIGTLFLIVCYLAFRLRRAERDVAISKITIEQCVAILGQLSALCQVTIDKTKDFDSKSEVMKNDLVEFQQAMAEFAVTVTDFMDKMKEAFSRNSSQPVKKDQKPN